MNHETFWTLAHDAAHWEFEIFLTVLTELVMAGIGWLFVRKHWKHHIARDKRDEIYGYLAKAAAYTVELENANFKDSSGCSMCDAGIPMSRSGTTHCVDDCSHGSVGYTCEKPKKP
jgi:hypothetical protein